ncbi:hypothetical protein J6590_066250 [Homalodisca vitripennis]|nr:hypothetical protein J6590_066250 [Homalodisca vitripennis]
MYLVVTRSKAERDMEMAGCWKVFKTNSNICLGHGRQNHKSGLSDLSCMRHRFLLNVSINKTPHEWTRLGPTSPELGRALLF